MSIPVRPGRSRRPAAAALLLAALLFVAGCDDEPADPAAVGGLAILSGDVGRTRLTVHGPGRGGSREVDVPDPATAWISGGPGGFVVATLADGRLAVADVDETAPAWRFLEPTSDGPPVGSLLFGAASPTGARVAALTLGAAGQFGAAIVEAGSGRSLVFPVDGEPILTGPAWIDEDRVAVVVVDADVGGAVSIADVTSGDVTGGPGNVRALAVSGDGTAVVWVSSVDGRLYGSNAVSWLAGQEIAAVPIEAPSADSVPGSVALDATGGRLAVVWENDEGRVVEIAILRRTSDGWSIAERLDAPDGDPRAVVGWLR
jgi:hypothetical protein